MDNIITVPIIALTLFTAATVVQRAVDKCFQNRIGHHVPIRNWIKYNNTILVNPVGPARDLEILALHTLNVNARNLVVPPVPGIVPAPTAVQMARYTALKTQAEREIELTSNVIDLLKSSMTTEQFCNLTTAMARTVEEIIQYIETNFTPMPSALAMAWQASLSNLKLIPENEI